MNRRADSSPIVHVDEFWKEFIASLSLLSRPPMNGGQIKRGAAMAVPSDSRLGPVVMLSDDVTADE